MHRLDDLQSWLSFLLVTISLIPKAAYCGVTMQLQLVSYSNPRSQVISAQNEQFFCGYYTKVNKDERTEQCKLSFTTVVNPGAPDGVPLVWETPMMVMPITPSKSGFSKINFANGSLYRPEGCEPFDELHLCVETTWATPQQFVLPAPPPSVEVLVRSIGTIYSSNAVQVLKMAPVMFDSFVFNLTTLAPLPFNATSVPLVSISLTSSYIAQSRQLAVEGFKDLGVLNKGHAMADPVEDKKPGKSVFDQFHVVENFDEFFILSCEIAVSMQCASGSYGRYCEFDSCTELEASSAMLLCTKPVYVASSDNPLYSENAITKQVQYYLCNGAGASCTFCPLGVTGSRCITSEDITNEAYSANNVGVLIGLTIAFALLFLIVLICLIVAVWMILKSLAAVAQGYRVPQRTLSIAKDSQTALLSSSETVVSLPQYLDIWKFDASIPCYFTQESAFAIALRSS
ncbi:unnamed protein product [Soboliphyme baturini]|uniref:HAP2-GCS1 domain-containing protein n=1 Tax=Soboliphyme baturini TaxID=241478 RepID=A0A183IBX7_9BILA|nr:unnamed protein product [Soboliphyme baturini]